MTAPTFTRANPLDALTRADYDMPAQPGDHAAIAALDAACQQATVRDLARQAADQHADRVAACCGGDPDCGWHGEDRRDETEVVRRA